MRTAPDPVVRSLLILSFLCCWADARGDEQAWFAIMQQQAERYQFTCVSPKGIVRMIEKPVFRHDAPSRNSDDIGGVWVWVDDHQRPVALGTVFGWTSAPRTRTVVHEFCSLSRGELRANWNTDERSDRWEPRLTTQWHPLPEAPTPSQARSVRELQLRKLARRFSAHTVDPSGKRWQLKLKPTPVYEYTPEKSETTLGGAVFVICQDTNTDVVLGIEAVRANTKRPWRFEFTLGSFTDWDLRVKLDRTEIWTENATDARGQNDRHWVRVTGKFRLQHE